MMALMSVAWLRPSKARRPAAISYSTQPSAHRSLRGVRLEAFELLRRHVLEGSRRSFLAS
jgi:hypothetical protein